MKQLIEKYQLARDQIGLKLMREYKRMSQDEVEILEFQRDLWNAMVELAQAMDKLTNK